MSETDAQAQEDAALGRKIREYREQLQLAQDDASLLVMCGQFLVHTALKLGGGTLLEVKFSAMTHQEQPAGDWIVKAVQVEPPLLKPCAQCGQEFAAKRPNQAYCTEICSHRKRQERYKEKQ